jgi:hypothetical protein
MAWLKKFPWLSLSLLLITYGVFGWYVDQSSAPWRHELVEQVKPWGWFVDEDLLLTFTHLLAAVLIVLISLALASPVAFLTIFLGNSLKFDTNTFFFLLGLSLIGVFAMRWFEYFARVLLLLSATILVRLDFQMAGYNKWQTFILLTFLCLFGFGLGVLSFTLWGHGTVEST